MKIRINISKTETKDLILSKDDNYYKKIVEFCNDNGIKERLIEPLYSKVEQSLKSLELINNNRNISKNDFFIFNKIKELQNIKKVED